MKRARIYRRGSRLYFHAVSRTVDGVWVMAAPFVGVEIGAAETFFGDTLERILQASRFGARALDPEVARKPLLDLARSRSWRGFITGTACCDVECDEKSIRFFPARFAHLRPFVPETEPAFTLPADALTITLGATLFAALRKVEPRRKAPKSAA